MATNGTLEEADFKKYSVETIDIAFGVVYSLFVFIGVLGNSLVITVVRQNKSMHTTTNCLLVNLAVADIVTLVSCPRTFSFAFYPIHPTGTTGDFICKFFTGNAVVSTAIACSVLTLTVLATERYHALVKPMRTRLRLSKENVGKLIAVLWLLALGISVPDYVANRYSVQYGRCICPFSLEMANDLSEHVLCTLFFLGCVPFFVLTFCYFQIIRGLFIKNTICSQKNTANDRRAKKRLAKLLLSVTLVFYVCYIPYAIFLSYVAVERFENLVKHQETLSVVLRAFELLVTCSSCLNPIIYAFQSSNYREGFRRIFWKSSVVDPSRKLSTICPEASVGSIGMITQNTRTGSLDFYATEKRPNDVLSGHGSRAPNMIPN